MKTKTILALLLLLSVSCVKEIEMKKQYIEKRLVLNGLICPDSLIAVRVSKTAPILGDYDLYTDNANVKLFCNDTLIENLTYSGKGRYVSKTVYPTENNYYTVEVELDGYPTIRATDTVPEKTFITYGTHSSGNSHDEYGDPHHDYEITIADKSKRNFYELFFITRCFLYHYDNHYYVDFQWGITVADPVLRADSELDFSPLTYVFTDNHFNGSDYSMYNKFLAASVQYKYNQSIVPTDNTRYAILRTTTSVYYNYRKFWLRHKNNQQVGDIIEEPMFTTHIGEPVPMYSNVENGYGIFAAYNQTIYKLKEQ